MASSARYMNALKGTMRKFDEWIGPYPYAQITVVDPPHGGSAAGGMEYPTLITADTTWWMPKSVLEPEFVVEHEFGHQYWYGMVATNEFENAWMDEGINQYMEAKVMDALYGKATSNVNSRLATVGEQGTDRIELRAGAGSRSAVASSMALYGWQFVRRYYLLENRADDADAGEPDRRKDGDARTAESTLTATSSNIPLQPTLPPL